MAKHLKKFETASEYSTYMAGEPLLPNVSLVDELGEVRFNASISQTGPLTFNVTAPGYISWGCQGESGATIEYKKNDGEWTEITALPLDPQTVQGATIDVVAGDVVQFRGDNASYADMSSGGVKGTFMGSTCYFNASGNIMSLINSANYNNVTEMTGDNYGAFIYLFALTAVVDASNLILPATTLTGYCYSSMFFNCLELIAAPELPATTLSEYCYTGMFEGCKLTTAPELPATTLSEYCYAGMFDTCINLIAAPELPATTLVERCYNGMFNGCTNLNYIKCLATDISAENCTNGWVVNVANNGTFVGVDGNPAGWATGNNGVPNNWECNFEPLT